MEIHHLPSPISLDEVYLDNDLNEARGEIAPIDVVSLAKDIEEKGLTQPVVLSKLADEEQALTGKKYRLICGYRRATAHKVLGWKYIDAIIRENMTEVDARVLNFTENMERTDLNILQQAKGILRLMKLGLNEYQIADKINQSRGWVQVRIMLLKLPSEIQLEAAAKVIGQEHIRKLYTIYNNVGKEAAFEACKKIKNHKISGKNVNELDGKVRQHLEKGFRKRPEMFMMQDKIRQSGMRNGIITQTIGWCAGEVSTTEFYACIEAFADEYGLDFTRPQETADANS